MTLPLLAFGVSAFALVVSTIGFYWQWLRIGKVIMVVGPDIRVDIDDVGLPRFLVQAVLMNDGAHSVAVVEMRGYVAPQATNEQAVIEWAAFVKSSQIIAGEAGKQPSTPWVFESRAGPFVVGARSSTLETILFVCRESYTFSQGDHRIQLAAVGGRGLRPVAVFDDTIHVLPETEALLRDVTATGGVSKGSFVFRRQGALLGRRRAGEPP